MKNDIIKDLIILVADKDIEHAIKGILTRKESIGMRSILYDIFVYSKRDPGCFRFSHNFLRPLINKYQYSLVIFDYSGSGVEGMELMEVENKVRGLLYKNGWKNRAEVVVIKPELEIWVWSESPHVAMCLGWAGGSKGLNKWIREKGYISGDDIKPTAPKECLDKVLRVANKARSSSIFENLGKSVSLKGCTDTSFNKLIKILKDWFPL